MSIVPRETSVGVALETELRFKKTLEANGISLTDSQRLNLKRYADLILDWNKNLNLISRTTSAEDLYFTHFLHSISPLFFLSIPAGLRVLDLGSGGGLPGIPLALLREDLSVVLVDSIGKKMKATASMVGELALANVTVVNARAEEMFRGNPRPDRFDLVLARAVAPLHDLVRWSRLLVRRCTGMAEWREKGNTHRLSLPALVAWKGGDLTDEIAALGVKGGGGAQVFNLVFSGSAEAEMEGKKIVVIPLDPAGGRT